MPGQPSPTSGSAKPAFWRGFRDCAPFILIVVPFSMMFGVVASDAGLDLLQVMAMSIIVIAGASQFTAVALMQEHAPVIVVVLTALAVNLRMAMYSAALVPHLGRAPLGLRALMAYLMVDQAFAVANKTFLERPEMTLSEKTGYYFGCMAAICPIWYAFTLIGALVGETIPPQFQLDFAVPVCFIALTAPLLRDLPSIVAALVSVIGAILFAPLPWGLGLIVAALVALIAGAQAELALRRRAGRNAA